MFLYIVSFIAFFSSVISLLPQVYKTYKTKSAKDLSIVMLATFFLCSLSWITYGFLTNAKPVWITNFIVGFLSLIMLALKIKYQKAEKDGKKNI